MRCSRLFLVSLSRRPHFISFLVQLERFVSCFGDIPQSRRAHRMSPATMNRTSLFSWILLIMTATVPTAMATSFSMLDNPQVLQPAASSSGWQSTVPRVASTQKRRRLGLRGSETLPSLSLETPTGWDVKIPVIHSRDMEPVGESHQQD